MEKWEETCKLSGGLTDSGVVCMGLCVQAFFQREGFYQILVGSKAMKGSKPRTGWYGFLSHMGSFQS